MIAQVSYHVTTIKLLLGDGAGQKSVFLFFFPRFQDSGLQEQ